MIRADNVPAYVITAANLVLASTGAIFACAWAYAVHHFIRMGARPFASAVEILLWVVVPPVMAILAFASLRLKPSTRVGIAMACVSTFVCLYFAEVVLRFAPAEVGTGTQLTTWADGASQEKKKEISQLAAKAGVGFDTRDRIEVLFDAQSRGIDAVPAVYPSVLLGSRQDGSLNSTVRIAAAEFLPLGGISNKLSVLCNELGDYVFYRSDEHGFNNPRGMWRSPRLDLAIVGDSFAHGFCVPPDQHFATLLRRHYPATLNLGMGGNGPLFELASLKEFLPALRPKIVLWAYFEKNDLNDLRDEARSPLLLRYLKAGFRQDLILKQAEIDQALVAYVEKGRPQALRKLHERKNPRPYSLSKDLIEVAKLTMLRSTLERITSREATAGEHTSGSEKAHLALFRSILLQAKRDVESWGGSLHFVYFPQWERYASSKPLDRNRAEVLKLVLGLQIPIIDLHAAIGAHPDPLSLFPFRLSGHYNANGHRLIAETMLKQLPLARDKSG